MDEEDQYNAEASGSQTAETPAVATASSLEAGEPKLSKNQQKKAARQARMAELKPLKRQAEKVRRQQRHHELSTGYAEGTLSAADKEIFEQRRAREREKRTAKRQEKLAEAEGVERNQTVWGGAVIMDLGFDELMTENEISSMDSQLSFAYSANRLSSLPFSAIIHSSSSVSISPRLYGRLVKRDIARWNRCHWNPDDVEAIAKQMKNEEGELPSGLKRGQELVYLSADSEEELTTLKENEVYIIGGLVDRNRHKMLCQNRAEKLGIRTARLPIGTYIGNMPTRKVLTVNQVFAILVEYNIRQDWKAAFEAVIPPRKFDDKKRKRTGGNWRYAEADGAAKDGQDEGEDSSDNGELGGSLPASKAPEPVQPAGDILMGSDEEAAFNAL